jgi:hypothetical protein
MLFGARQREMGLCCLVRDKEQNCLCVAEWTGTVRAGTLVFCRRVAGSGGKWVRSCAILEGV